MNKEHFIDGQHNGGVFNSFNHGIYTYCYQNPIRLVDPNGKQVDFSSFMGMSPEQFRSQVVANEVQKLAIEAAKPAAISHSRSISFPLNLVNTIVFGIETTLITKEPKEGTLVTYGTFDKTKGPADVGVSEDEQGTWGRNFRMPQRYW